VPTPRSWKPALLIAGLAVAGAGAMGAALVLVKPAKPAKRAEPLTPAEKAPLTVVEEGGQRRLRHPALGFSVLHPGAGFRESPEVVAALTGGGPDPETQSYGFLGPDMRSTLVISMMKNMGGSREALSQHIDGFQRGLAGSAPAGNAVRWQGKEIVWDDHRHVARVSASIGDVAHVDVAAYAIQPPGGPPYIVNVMTTAPEANQFPGLLDSFRP
jgi:hypothetical protein